MTTRIYLIISIIINIIFLIVWTNTETEVVETVKYIESEKEIVYINEDTNEETGDIYWYYSYHTMGGVIGYDIVKGDDGFPYKIIYQKIIKTCKDKYEKDGDFIQFDNIVKVNEEAYNFQNGIND